MNNNILFGRKFLKQSLILISLFLVLSVNNTVLGTWIAGAGGRSCGYLLEIENNRKQIDEVYLQFVTWIQGYISGKNSMNGSQKSRGISHEALYFSVINYCRKKPLDMIADAVDEIYNNQL